MENKLLFVFNPISGKGVVKNKLYEIINIFTKNGWLVNSYPTQCAGDASRIIKEKGNQFDLVVIAGGDGTLNEGISGIMELPSENRPPIGYIPTGTTNDFASNLGISKNLVVAAKNIAKGKTYKYDIGYFNDKSFVYVAAFGAFTDVAYETPQQNKNILGQTAYFLEGIKKLYNLKSYKMKVCCDEDEVEDEFIFGMISNTNYLGGFKAEKAFKAQLNDGLFEVILIRRPKTLMEVQDLIAHLLMQDFSTDIFRVFKTKKVSFDAKTPVPWTLDGEFGGAKKEACVEIENEAVTLLL